MFPAHSLPVLPSVMTKTLSFLGHYYPSNFPNWSSCIWALFPTALCIFLQVQLKYPFSLAFHDPHTELISSDIGAPDTLSQHLTILSMTFGVHMTVPLSAQTLEGRKCLCFTSIWAIASPTKQALNNLVELNPLGLLVNFSYSLNCVNLCNDKNPTY